jgi:acid stress-induced BolA-like protein IbaG/YrbA
MLARRTVGVLLLALPLVAGLASAQGFKFSNPDPDEQAAQAQQAAREDRIAYDLSTPCRADLKGKKIMVVIGERRSNGYVDAEQRNYGPLFDAINNRMKALGLRVYTPEEIRAQIAQAEIDAYFKNNPDLALSAAKRLGASFVLRGLITSETTMNPIMAVNQVAVGMNFTLTGSNGRIVSEAGANSASYAGANVSQMALTLVNEQADEVVARLYGDYCRNAGLGQPAPKGKGK